MEPDGVIRILIADDHPIFRDGLTRLLEADAAYRVVGVAGDGRDALRLVAELNPDLLLLDLSMPTFSGMDVLQSGARGVLLKEAATPMLYKCIRSVMQGQLWIGRDHFGTVVQAMRDLTTGATKAKQEPFGLTPRELEIVAGIAAGETNREIAERLSVREHTVKHHLTHIFDKTGVFSRLELAVFALNHGLGQYDRGTD
jgi:two-component system, NarL family, nitrate/nitrite response regulator NarL